MSNQCTQLLPEPGVKRDTTPLDSNYYGEAIWCRFNLKKPRKMGGYRKMATFTAPVKAVHTFNKTTSDVIHSFSSSKIEAIVVDNNGNGGAVYDRTPSGFQTYANYTWTVDTAYDATGSGQTRIFAHAARDDDTPTPIFYGTIDSTAVLAPILLTDATRPASTVMTTINTKNFSIADATGYSVGSVVRVTGAGASGAVLFTSITSITGTSGAQTGTFQDNAYASLVGTAIVQILGTTSSIVTIGPYLFYTGRYGLIANTDVNNPTKSVTGEANQANPVGSAVLRGLPMRGGGQSPSAIFWSADSVIRAAYVGGTLVFQYDIVSSQSSLLAKNSIIEYDGVYYWLGLDRALMYNGQVKEVPNLLNNQWFYSNLNWDYKEKVWATKIPRYGEIWWFFPKGNSTYCNWAIVYNTREGIWFDTPITRSAGYYVQTFRYPVWGDEDGALWQHEFGWDKIDGSSITAITSSFTSHNIGYPMGGAIGDNPTGPNTWTRIERVEPDFQAVGDMTLEILSQEYANAPQNSIGTYAFTQDQVRVDMRNQARIMNLKFQSAVQGGYYQMGLVLLHIDVGDRRE